MGSRDEVHRIQWLLTSQDAETVLFRAHCQKKAEASWPAVHTAMEDFIDELANTAPLVLAQCELTDTRILDWVDAQSKWLQVDSEEHTGVTATGSALPLQLALAVTLETPIPLGGTRQSWRNRFFLSPLNQDIISTNGRVLSSITTQVLDAVEQLNTDLVAIDAQDVGAAEAGLAVVSDTLDEANEVLSLSMDQILDTQRRRAKSLVRVRTRRAISNP